MARDYTTTGLIESIQNRGQFALNDSTFTAARVLALADEEMRTTIVPLVRENRNDHFVTSEDVTTTAATAYDIPEEALNRGLFNVAMLDSQGNPYGLTVIDFDRLIDLPQVWSALRREWRRGYYVRGDQVHLYPSSIAGETLRLYYERLPNRLIATSGAAQVVSVNTVNGEITCVTGTVPDAWAVGTELCIVKGKPGFTLRVESSIAVTATTSVVDLPVADVANVVAGDWIAPVGDSPILQLPTETHPLLAQRMACKLLEAMGDEYLLVAKEDWKEELAAYKRSYPTRTEKGPRRVFGLGGRLADWTRHR